MQRQWLGGFLLAVLGIAMVASLYLDVTAQAAISGREIQNLASDIVTVQQSNADLQTVLAELQANSAMEERAQRLGYQSMDPTEVQYVVVPGYEPPQPRILTVPVLKPSAPSIPPEYTESLIEWLQETLRTTPSMSVTGISQ
jgi:cell division protein FtsB